MLVFNKGVSKDITPKTYEVEHDGLMVAMHESYVEFERLNGAIPDAMSACYEMWCLGDETPEQKHAVLEGTISDVFGKIKAFFIAIGKKIKAWVMSVVNYFRNMIMNDKNFVEKYKNTLTTKATDKFKWSGHKWDVKTLTSDVDISDVLAKEGAGKIHEAPTLSKAEVEKLKNLIADAKDYKKTTDDTFKAKSPQDYANKITKACTGSKSENMTFSQISVETMIAAIEDDDIVKRIQESCDKINDSTDAIVDVIEISAGKLKDANEGNANLGLVTDLVRYITEGVKYENKYNITLLNTYKSLNVAMRQEFGSVLRSFLRYKPEK